MNAKLCDRCGKVCGDEKYEITCHKFTKIKKVILGANKIIDDYYDYDLCIKCASEFEKWLEGEENNNESNME